MAARSTDLPAVEAEIERIRSLGLDAQIRSPRRLMRSPTPMRARPEPDLDLADLDHLSRSRLRDLWQKEVGEKPPGSFGRELLALGVAYVRQERRYGGLRKASSRELDRRFERTLAGSSSEGRGAPLGRPGTILVREWQGITHHV